MKSTAKNTKASKKALRFAEKIAAHYNNGGGGRREALALNVKDFESPLVQMSRPYLVIVGMPALRMRHAQPVHELWQYVVLLRPQTRCQLRLKRAFASPATLPTVNIQPDARKRLLVLDLLRKLSSAVRHSPIQFALGRKERGGSRWISPSCYRTMQPSLPPHGG